MDYPETKRQRGGTFFERHSDVRRLMMPADVMAALEELTNSNPASRNQAFPDRDNITPAYRNVRGVGAIRHSPSQSSHVAGVDTKQGPSISDKSDAIRDDCGVAAPDDFQSRNETRDIAELADFRELGDFDEETNRLLDVIWPECAAARSDSVRGEPDTARPGAEKLNGGGPWGNAAGVLEGDVVVVVGEGNLLERQGSSTAATSASLDALRASPRVAAHSARKSDERQTDELVPRISQRDMSSQVVPSVACAPIDPNQMEQIERAVRGSSPGVAVAVPLIQPKLQSASSIPDTTTFSRMVAEFTKAMAAPATVPATAVTAATMPPVTSAFLLRQLDELGVVNGRCDLSGDLRFGASPEVSGEATSRRWTSRHPATFRASQTSQVSPITAAMACDSLGLLGGGLPGSTKELLRLVEESIRANEFALQQMGKGKP
ncbi:hypothetical protein CLOP_g9476 [Closterium sp. NIES-67]|nr:hypothetical protein CLOP_g9476 [Closterium sp. NIES-67]